MSKAFTREDDAAELAPALRLPTLPPGVRNYITPEGAEALRGEVERLQAERSRIIELKDRTLLGNLDQRLARVQQILATIEIAPPATGEEVRFGASVSVKYPFGDVETFRIVGVNEIDLDRNWISWQSPLAKALLNAKAGDRVRFKAPNGEQVLEILAVN